MTDKKQNTYQQTPFNKIFLKNISNAIYSEQVFFIANKSLLTVINISKSLFR